MFPLIAIAGTILAGMFLVEKWDAIIAGIKELFAKLKTTWEKIKPYAQILIKKVKDYVQIYVDRFWEKAPKTYMRERNTYQISESELPPNILAALQKKSKETEGEINITPEMELILS